TDVRPRLICRHDGNQRRSVVDLHVDWGSRAIAVGCPALNVVAAGVVYVSDVGRRKWRTTARYRCWTVTQLGCACFKLDVDRVRGAILQRGWRRDVETVPTIVAKRRTDIGSPLVCQNRADQGGPIVELHIDRRIQAVTVSRPASHVVASTVV